MKSLRKRKILNDPVYGFINIDSELIHDLIEHPYFQRLRRIQQLGVTNFVYPGTNHTRFQHALGTMHLMTSALQSISSKNHQISSREHEAAIIAILLHDIGHGPFSHALEQCLIQKYAHEELTLHFMEYLNSEFHGRLSLAIEIFKGSYKKKFLHQLVDSQLDVDRLDYLKRDSFFSGVNEGTIGSDRIIKMLNVVNDELVIESKGIYSIENFLIARRLMFWQVYFHKTVISAEQLLIKILHRARYLAAQNYEVFAPPALKKFLYNAEVEQTKNHNDILETFAALDDSDILSAVKAWTSHEDYILRLLATKLIHRDLLQIELQDVPFSDNKIKEHKAQLQNHYKIVNEDIPYLIFTGSISNNAYNQQYNNIRILFKNGDISNIENVTEMQHLTLSQDVKKYFLCYPKECKD